MMNYILFDGKVRTALLPFTYTRPVADIRIGILTIREKWEYYLKKKVSTATEDYLSDKYPLLELEQNVFIAAFVLPTSALVAIIKNLQPKECIVYQNQIIAYCTTEIRKEVDLSTYYSIIFKQDLTLIEYPWDIFVKNEIAIKSDFKCITKNRISQPLSSTNTLIGAEYIFVEEGAEVNCSVLNASTGPIYIGKNAKILEGCLVRGGLALCEGAILKMGTKLYGATTVGPQGKIGGEVYNSVLFGNSNKGHDGYLGNSVLGEWCNIGAGSNISNLKNNYASVRLWDYATEKFMPTELQFCGLLMGDHSKCSINTMFNTGTVVGVSANIFGEGFPEKFIPSFSWGGHSNRTTYKIDKAFETAEIVMKRRGVALANIDKVILSQVFKNTTKWRNC